MTKIVIGITGASGSIYAARLLYKLNAAVADKRQVAVVFTDTGREVFKHELGDKALADIPFAQYNNNNFYAPFASGSSDYGALIVAPCSMGALARMAHGMANDLLARTADVMLKERRKLILLTRETPLSLIHLQNMQQITLSGGIICPASPSFYSRPQTIEQAVDTVVDRALSLVGIDTGGYQWGSEQNPVYQA